jgi:NADPH2:quinone reductase
MSHRAYRIHRHGDESVLQLETLPLPVPGPGQVRVRHTAIGINFIDIYHRTGLYPLPLPSGLGLEAAGVVEAVGTDVRGWRVGDRVGYCSGPAGAYAETHVVDAGKLIALPAHITDEQAAAILLKGLTAAYLLHKTFPVQAGQTILWHAAAGGVGLLACQWAKALGARVIGTAGSAEKAALALAHGCDHVIRYREEKVPAAVRKLTGGVGVPVVYDSVGKDTFESSLDSLAVRGMLVSFGNASGAVPDFSPLLLAQKGSLYLTRPTLGHYSTTPEELQGLAKLLFDALEKGWIKVEVNQRYRLESAAEAHRALAARETTGASVLLP